MSSARNRALSSGESGSVLRLRLPPGPVVKICGLTRPEDVQLAYRLGAWATGFVFAPSPRRVTVERARELLRQTREQATGAAALNGAATAGPALEDLRLSRPLAVGVFADCSAAEIARAVRLVGLDAVQLHGCRGPRAAEVRQALARWTLPRPESSGQRAPVLVTQAVAVAPADDNPESLRRAVAAGAGDADLVLLDTRVAERFGGTGAAFRWELAACALGQTRFLVAGGIGPENVCAALRQSGAWGVDVSSGIEVSPGVKNVRLMTQLMRRVDESRPGYGLRDGTKTVGQTNERKEPGLD